MGADGDVHSKPLENRLHGWHVSGLHKGTRCRKGPQLTANPSVLHSDNGRTILLLDDDTNTLLVLHTILEKTAANIVECANEICVLKRCEELLRSIDLLVADVVLEDSNGPAVVRKIKPLQPSMRLLYISGFSMPELQRRGLLSTAEMSPGCVEFLQKPFSPEEFLDRVQRLLVRRAA